MVAMEKLVWSDAILQQTTKVNQIIKELLSREKNKAESVKRESSGTSSCVLPTILEKEVYSDRRSTCML